MPCGDTCPVWRSHAIARGQHACLAGTGASQYEGGLGGEGNGGELLGIEILEDILHPRIIPHFVLRRRRFGFCPDSSPDRDSGLRAKKMY